MTQDLLQNLNPEQKRAVETTEDRLAASQQYESALSRLLVVVENYPELRSVETVQNLMIQLEGTENRIKVERDNYSAVATTYNTMIQRFPKNILAGMFGFDKKDLYTAQTGAENAPKVNLTQPATQGTPAQ